MADKVKDLDQEERRKQRARARRNAQRGDIEGAIECEICKMNGKEYKANSLVTHLRTEHAMDALAYEETLGIEPGSGKIVSDKLKEKFAASGAKGAKALAEKRALEAGEVSDSDEDEDQD